MVHVSLALHGLGDVLVQLLNHLEVTEPVLLLEELFLVWELILISLKSMTGKNLKTQEPRHSIVGVFEYIYQIYHDYCTGWEHLNQK